MKLLSSKLATDWETIYFGGQYYMPGDPKYKADMPWTDRRVRQAMNMAVNRQELRDTIFRGKGTPMYVSGFEASLEGWNPAWAERFDSLYGYNPTRAKELLKELVIHLARSTSDCSRTPVPARPSIHGWSKPWRSILTPWGSNLPSSRWMRGKSLACGGTRRWRGYLVNIIESATYRRMDSDFELE